jgi:hypothetical protein
MYGMRFAHNTEVFVTGFKATKLSAAVLGLAVGRENLAAPNAKIFAIPRFFPQSAAILWKKQS